MKRKNVCFSNWPYTRAIHSYFTLLWSAVLPVEGLTWSEAPQSTVSGLSGALCQATVSPGHAARGLPLPLLPSTLLSRISLMIESCLFIWPKKHIFLLLMMSKSCLFVPNFSRTWAFDIFCFQLILPILLRKNISQVSSFSHRILVRVQVSQPYKRIE